MAAHGDISNIVNVPVFGHVLRRMLTLHLRFLGQAGLLFFVDHGS